MDIDRALIISNSSNTEVPKLMFPDFVKPSQTQLIKTKYFQAEIQLLYDEFEDFANYTKDLIDEETKILRDLLRLVVIVVNDLKDLKRESLVEISKKFEEDLNEGVNLVLYFDSNDNESTIGATKYVDDLHEYLLDNGCFWEIITDEKLDDEKYGIERLKEVFHTVSWTVSEKDDKNVAQTTVSVDEYFDKLEKDKTGENEDDFKEVDIMAMVGRIQDFKTQINSLSLKDSDKHDRILKFIENLNI